MIARRFAVLTLSAALGYGFALHELPRHHAIAPIATVAPVSH